MSKIKLRFGFKFNPNWALSWGPTYPFLALAEVVALIRCSWLRHVFASKPQKKVGKCPGSRHIWLIYIYIFFFCLGDRFLSSVGVGKSCVLPIRVPNPSPTLDKNLASLGPGIFSSIGVGVWRRAPEAFPGSNTTLDTFQFAIVALVAFTNQRTFLAMLLPLLRLLLKRNRPGNSVCKVVYLVTLPKLPAETTLLVKILPEMPPPAEKIYK